MDAREVGRLLDLALRPCSSENTMQRLPSVPVRTELPKSTYLETRSKQHGIRVRFPLYANRENLGARTIVHVVDGRGRL